jgi:hypothetical protein
LILYTEHDKLLTLTYIRDKIQISRWKLANAKVTFHCYKCSEPASSLLFTPLRIAERLAITIAEKVVRNVAAMAPRADLAIDRGNCSAYFFNDGFDCYIVHKAGTQSTNSNVDRLNR